MNGAVRAYAWTATASAMAVNRRITPPILCDPLDGVKQMSTARDADMIPAMRCFLCISRISLWVMVVLAAGCSGGQPQPGTPPPPAPAPAPAVAEGTAGHLFVTNERSGDLSIIDLATER